MLLTGIALSLIVNAFVTGLIVLRIFMVYQEVKPTSTETTLGATGGRKLRSIMFILIESGMALFSMQLVRLVLGLFYSQNVAMEGYDITLGIDQMLHVTITNPFTYFTDTNVGFWRGRASSLPSFWYGSRWDCLSTMTNPW